MYKYIIPIYFIFVVFVCIRIIKNTTPSKGLAYLLIVVMFPVVGVLFYMSFGFNYRKSKLYRKKIEIDFKTFPELDHQLSSYSNNVLNKLETKLGNYFSLAKLFVDKSLISDNNEVELLINGEEKFPEVLKSLQEAKNHIHIEYYIYENDEIGNQIATILIEKAKQGVKIRFIYDDFGSKSIRKGLVKKLQDAGIETYPFYKINIVQFANRINYRNHRKIIVIDGVVGFIGGINVSDKYINPNTKKLFWRDTHLKITGTSVVNLQYIFLTDWNFCSDQNIGFSNPLFPQIEDYKTFGNKAVQIVSSGPDSDYQSTLYSLMQIIMLAKECLHITTPYFIPDKSFLDAIKIAALSGVKVKLLVPGISDTVIVNMTSQSHYRELLEAGIEVYRYNKGFVHAKTLVCDNKIATIGTVNLDNRSFDLNFEVNAVVFDEEIAKKLAQQFETDIIDSERLNLKEWKKRPPYIKMIEKILKLFSPLM